MNREAAIDAGARALAPGSWEDEHWRSPVEQARSQVLARYAATAVIDAALPHLVGEPVGYVVVNRANNGFAWLSMDGAVFQRGQVPYERARLDNQIVCALVPMVEP